MIRIFCMAEDNTEVDRVLHSWTLDLSQSASTAILVKIANGIPEKACCSTTVVMIPHQHP